MRLEKQEKMLQYWLFSWLCPPNLRLDWPLMLSGIATSKRTYLVISLLAVFLVQSGIMYDVIMVPPPFGIKLDDSGRISHIITFMEVCGLANNLEYLS